MSEDLRDSSPRAYVMSKTSRAPGLLGVRFMSGPSLACTVNVCVKFSETIHTIDHFIQSPKRTGSKCVLLQTSLLKVCFHVLCVSGSAHEFLGTG